jgi:CRP-like cAMP-binding protein
VYRLLKVNYARLLEKTGILKYIQPEDYDKVVNELNISSMKFVNNQIILRQDDKAEQIAVVIDGEVKAEKIHGSGSDNMAHTFMEGDLFAYEGIISSSRTYPMDYISDGDSQIAFIDVENLRDASLSKELMQGIAGYMADESIKRMYRIETVSKKKLRDRIMTYLQIQESELGVSAFSLELSREELAEELCVNRSALSNELSKMQKDGIIVVDRRKVKLK